MAVPHSLGKRIVLDESQSKKVVRLLTDQNDKLYQFDGSNYERIIPSESSEDTVTENR